MGSTTLNGYGDMYPPGSVAIVGVSCRYPEADSVDEFWDLLLSGKSTVREPPEDRLDLTNHPRHKEGRKYYGNFLKDAASFDNRFFKKSSLEATACDPQQRVLLEVCYEALESAGHFGPNQEDNPSDHGVYVAAIAANYYDNISHHPQNAYSFIGSSRSFYSGRISHQFGLTGPAVTIDTACSASLVAIHQACQAIRAGECSRAIAAGTNVLTSPYDFQNLAAATFLSPTGQCKPFDAAADGYCRGEGVAALVLESIETAVENGDNILGVILGTAVSQNTNEAHITVPCASSQNKLYDTVLKRAGLHPDEISYVESHGTGTQVGDPIECQSLKDIFGNPERPEKLYFGSVKSQIGHTESSAGLASVIKVMLMMQHERILPQYHLKTLNPKIPELEPFRMEISSSNRAWKSDLPFTACVSGYGAAGSNGALVIREPPQAFEARSHERAAASKLEQKPLYISAATQGSLQRFAAKLHDKLQSCRTGDPASDAALVSDTLFSLATRQNHSLKLHTTGIVTDYGSLEKALSKVAVGMDIIKTPSVRPVVLAFGGQERDFVGLSKETYESTALLKHHLNACDAAFQQLSPGSIFPSIFASETIEHLPTLHACLFSIQYAVAQCWIDSGLAPAAVIGHSMGQFAALCISGSLSLADAMKLAVSRAQLITKLWGPEPGSMLSIQADMTTVSRMISAVGGRTLELACQNYPTGHVVVGSGEQVDALEKFIASNYNGVKFTRLRVTNGFHSVFTEPILSSLELVANRVQWRTPSIHMELCTQEATPEKLGPWIIPEHTRKPVYFASAVERLQKKLGDCIWLEAGAKTSVTSLVRQNFKGKPGKHTFLPSAVGTGCEPGALSELTAQLWAEGVNVQFWPYHGLQGDDYRAFALPPYQFEKTKHWLDFKNASTPMATPTATPTTPAAPIVARPATPELTPPPSLSSSPSQASPSVGQLTKPTVISNPMAEYLPSAGAFCFHAETKGSVSTFHTDPASQRFKMLTQRHFVFGQALAPLALYLELPSRAALALVPGATYRTHVARFDFIEVISPIGLDPKRLISQTLERMGTNNNEWSFVVTTANKADGASPTIHSKGRFRLVLRDDEILAQTMQGFSCQTQYDRCAAMLASDEADKIQGASQVYRASWPMFDYKEDMYRGVKAIASVGNESVGRVVVRAHPDIHPDNSLYDSSVLDCMMQNAAILVNTFINPSREYVFVCIGIERTIAAGSFDVRSGTWLAHCVVTLNTGAEVECETYMYDERTRELVLAFAFHFKRTPVSVWEHAMAKANEAKKIQFAAAKRPAAPVLEPTPVAQPAVVHQPVAPVSAAHGVLKQPKPVAAVAPVVEAPGPLTNGVSPAPSGKAELHKVLNRMTDCPFDEMEDDAALEDIGVDSLMANEVLKEINSSFSTDMTLAQLLACRDLKALATALGL